MIDCLAPMVMLRAVQPAPTSRTTVPSMGCGYAVCLALAIGGLALLYNAQAKWQRGQRNDAWFAGSFGAIFCATGLGLIVPMQRIVAQAQERANREALRPKEPWTWDPAWTDLRGIRQAGRRHGGTLLFFGVAACAISLPPAFLVLPREAARGNYGAFALLVFPLAALAIFAGALRDAWRRRKYGIAHFVPAALPIPVGGELSGMVIVSRPVTPIGEGRVALVCTRTTQVPSGGGNKRQTREEMVGQTEREIPRGDWQALAGESRLFLQLPVRGGASTTMGPLAVENPTYEWRLRVETTTPGADFVAEFVLPVFEVAGVARSGVGREPAAASPARDRLEIWRAAGIREEPQPHAVRGDALVFPARVGRAAIAAPLIFALVFMGLAVGLWWTPIPGFISIVLGFVALVPAWVVRELWRGGGERVWVESDAVCVQPRGRPTARLPLDDLQKFEMNRAVGVGEVQFYRIEIRRRPAREGHFGKMFRVASLVRGDEAAGATVAWLEERLTRP